MNSTKCKYIYAFVYDQTHRYKCIIAVFQLLLSFFFCCCCCCYLFLSFFTLTQTLKITITLIIIIIICVSLVITKDHLSKKGLFKKKKKSSTKVKFISKK
ncbi:hypothetical protein, unlikely [Trypanosoma brucei gambiense DAL972]|uniref:Uncharacterized protein n=1 Tax=Trypanosoma brucei gambiense (strain MHOM/CI/86/DAL972) TaxID=679716 RepID=C9ZU95_TRYB9|nr:hypothetical protein, unlikely [Trypanosoma brucei gambiense DAL972]CBH12981.1 hypothetical protein, unlikely [Trypanosoma brucei gambiense DAL972]|eukprot:XP_011775260.1 hypothetical protein, unlikely [Trypanosoma brucei gambiense DAL972]